MRRRRLLRLLLLALGAGAAALVALSFPLFVFPPTDAPGRADAVVVFAGGDGERQDEGVRLTREGLARCWSSRTVACRARATPACAGSGRPASG